MVIAWRWYSILCFLVVLIGCLCVSPCTADLYISKKDITHGPENFSVISDEQLLDGSVANAYGTSYHGMLDDTNAVWPPVRNTPEYVPGQVIVRFKPAIPLADQSSRVSSSRLNAEAGAVSAIPLTLMGVSDAELVSLSPGADVQEAITVYEKDPDVLYAQPNFLYRFTLVPNDPDIGQQWGLLEPDAWKGGINALDAWDIRTESSSTVIAVIDTGIDYTHPDLQDNIWINSGETGTDTGGNDKRFNGIDDDLDGYVDDWQGWNFYTNTSDIRDLEGHGTHIAGIIGAMGNNGIGVSGVTWRTQIMPLDVSNLDGTLSTLSAIQAIQYAKEHGASVIHGSWGGYSDDTYLRDIIAANPDLLFVFAAGNDFNNNDINPFYPASYPFNNIISVAAVSYWSDNFAGFTNYGPVSVDLAAPGDYILSTYLGGSYRYMDGTSTAAPFVTGVAALIKEERPGFSSEQIRDYILQTVERKDVYAPYVSSHGRLNAYNALRATQGPVADFTTDVTAGSAPLMVFFYDRSYAEITSWNWSFGEGNYSTAQDTIFVYEQPGTYTVNLTVMNADRTGTISRPGYIRVMNPPTTDVGSNWTLATGSAAFPGRCYPTSVVFDGKMWVIGGYDGDGTSYNDVWSSFDGVNWTQETSSAKFSPRYVHASVVYDGKMWVISGGSFGEGSKDVWYSDNGRNWSLATDNAAFSGRSQFPVIDYDGKMWIIGGRISGNEGSNDVWYSSDGKTWTPATEHAAFQSRWGHSAVVFNNTMWVIGGWSGYPAGAILYNDVWYSSDGVHWMEATGNAGFPGRLGHNSVIYDNKIWVIGGSLMTNVWYSEDGTSWTEATPVAAFPAREGHSSMVFNNRMWLTSGYWWVPFNDVWYSPPYNIPTANFMATPRSGSAPQSVQFNDTSEGFPSRWYWDFGDNSTSDKQNPRHRYSTAGRYNITLTAANLAGSNTTLKVRYITVTNPAPPGVPEGYFPQQSNELDTSGSALRLTSITSAQNVRQGSPVKFFFDQNISQDYSIAINGILFVPDGDIAELEGIVQDIRTGDIQEVPGRLVAGYERIELIGINPQLVRNVSILFQVADIWLVKEKAAYSDIVLMRYHDNAWEDLPTQFDHQSGGSYYFTALTPGFSYFAVTVKSNESISAPVLESTSTRLPVSGTVPPFSQAGTFVSLPTTAVPKGIVTNLTIQPAPAASQPRDPGMPLLVVFGIPIIIAMTGGTYLVRRWWIRRQNPALFREYE